MAIEYIDRCQVIAAPAAKIREQFNNHFQTPIKTGGVNYARGWEVTTNLSYAYVSEYNANKVYIADAQNSNNPASTYVICTNSSVTSDFNRYIPDKIRTASKPSLPQNLSDTHGLHNLRGYLVPHKVSEFVSGGSVRISRAYNNAFTVNNYNMAGVDYNAAKTVKADTATRLAVDNLAEYADYIVPQIHWYYEDDNGTTQSNGNAYYFWYFFTATNVKYQKGRTLLSSVVYDIKTINAGTPYYFAFSPPYIKGDKNNYATATTNIGGIFSGEIYVDFPDDNLANARIIEQNYNNVPYVMLCNVPQTFNDYDLTPITGQVGVSAVSSQLSSTPLPNGFAGDFPAYKSVDDVIALFADYGIKLYTSMDDVLTPPPSTDGVINPDNPSEQIPYYPDNSTDTTPIEQAYITPSTFGQSCVYNPLATKDFLRWICDNTVDIGNWARLFANPVDVIMGINLYNLDIVAHDAAHVRYNAQTNILGVTSNIANYSILDGYNNIVDGGTLTLQAYYGNYADFTSMTYQMFIPFVGFTSLRACDVVNKTLHLYYAVDFATGAAVAFVNSDDKMIYSSPCTVAGKIPVSTSDKNSQIINNTLSGIGAIGGLLGGIASGNIGGGVGALLNGLGGMQLQTNYANKGSLSAVNIYKLLPAFVERTRYDLFFPSGEQQYLGAKYQGFAGAPSTQFDTLLNCVDASGFVQADVVYLTSQTATDAEKEQIITLIKSGIYL